MTGEPPPFHPVSAGSIKLAGEWAALLVPGGADERFKGSAKEALGLAAAAVEEPIEARYEQVAVYYSDEPPAERAALPLVHRKRWIQ